MLDHVEIFIGVENIMRAPEICLPDYIIIDVLVPNRHQAISNHHANSTVVIISCKSYHTICTTASKQTMFVEMFKHQLIYP